LTPEEYKLAYSKLREKLNRWIFEDQPTNGYTGSPINWRPVRLGVKIAPGIVASFSRIADNHTKNTNGNPFHLDSWGVAVGDIENRSKTDIDGHQSKRVTPKSLEFYFSLGRMISSCTIAHRQKIDVTYSQYKSLKEPVGLLTHSPQLRGKFHQKYGWSMRERASIQDWG